ncbi:MAG: hypothetical protein AN484_15405 [Aphanizomenon flos-aquae WA102]|uniref:Uncharacterized protein n=1 Tax=Aphanizomenon flos-aquae WA102 TaxID=1710896 RepID=A0A1B7X0I8_APHFL|nr:MAG: hypothetical protein AN484_15405 [Aphanizomenon flos-aquae WA102]
MGVGASVTELEGNAFGRQRVRDRRLLGALRVGHLVLVLRLALPFAVSLYLHADEDGLAAGGADVFQVLGRGRVEPDLVGVLAGELTDEHGERLAVLAGEVLGQAEALVVDEEEAGGRGAVLPLLDLLELGLDEFQLVGAVRADGRERRAVVVIGGHGIRRS